MFLQHYKSFNSKIPSTSPTQNDHRVEKKARRLPPITIQQRWKKEPQKKAALGVDDFA
jgi:hypothetical protein